MHYKIPSRSSQGHSLLEVLVVVTISSTLAAFTLAVLRTVEKTPHNQLKDLLVTTQINSRANSGNPHRVIKRGNSIDVQRNLNGLCTSTSGWITIPGRSIELTSKTTLDDFSTCFDGRGSVSGVDLIYLKTEEKRSEISVSQVGDVSIKHN